MAEVKLHPPSIVLGIDAEGKPVALCDIVDNPLNGWQRIKQFNMVGASCYCTAKIYGRNRIPDHEFFNKPVLEVKKCH